MARGKDRRKDDTGRPKEAAIWDAAGRNGLRRQIHPKLLKNVRAINSCRSPAVSLAGSTCCREAQGIAPNQF